MFKSLIAGGRIDQTMPKANPAVPERTCDNFLFPPGAGRAAALPDADRPTARAVPRRVGCP